MGYIFLIRRSLPFCLLFLHVVVITVACSSQNVPSDTRPVIVTKTPMTSIEQPVAPIVSTTAPISNSEGFIKEATLGRGAIASAAVSPDKTRLAILTGQGLWLYDVDTLQPLQIYENISETGMPGHVSWSPDSKQLMLWQDHYDGWTARIIDGGTGQEIRLLKGDTLDVLKPSWSPDGMHIAFPSRDGLVHVWNIEQGEELIVLNAQVESVSSVVWSPDGSLLATGGTGLVTVWSSDSWQQHYEFEYDLGGPGYNWIGDLAWSPDGILLAGIAGSSSHKWIWNTAEETAQELPHLGAIPDALSWSPDGSHLIFAGDAGIQILDVTEEREVSILETTIYGTKELEWLPGKSYLLAVGNNQLELWDVQNGQLAQRVNEHIGWDASLKWSPDSTLLAVQDVGSVKIWDVNCRCLVLTLEEHVYKNLFAWAPDSKQLVGWSLLRDWNNIQNGQPNSEVLVQAWDLTTGQMLYRANDQEGSAVRTLQWTSAGVRLVSHGHQEVRIWQPIDGLVLDSIAVEDGSINQLSLSPDGHLLAMGMSDSTIQIWQIENNRVIQQLDGVISPQAELIWSPDSQWLVSAGPASSLQVWHVTSGELTFQWESRGSHIVAVTWSSASDKMAVGLFSGQIFIWDRITGEQPQVLDMQTPLDDVSWSPDGNKLAILEDAGRIQIWCWVSCEP